MSEMPERIAIRLNRAYNELDRRLEDGYLMAAFVLSQERADLESAEGYESFVRADLVPQWIPVGERLPDRPTRPQIPQCVEVACLVDGEKQISYGWYCDDGKWLVHDYAHLKYTGRCVVTHWRERPEYPNSD